MDLATTGEDGPPTYTTFLTDLNPTSSLGPDYDSAHYYSVSASNYLDELPIGPPVDFLYYLAVPPSGVVDDGLVALYSAQNPVLGRESRTWHVGAGEAAANATVESSNASVTVNRAASICALTDNSFACGPWT